MQFFGQVPFLRLLLAFLAGLITAYHALIDIDIPVWSFLCMTIVVLLIHRIFHVSYKFRWISGCIICIYLFAFGYFWINERKSSTKDLKNIYEQEKCIIFKVNDKPVFKGNFIKFKAIISFIDDSMGFVSHDNKILVYIENDSSENICYGDEIICNGRIDEIQAPQNPGEFDYRKFTLNQGISGQIWLRSPSWEIMNKNKDENILSRVFALSEYLNGKLSKVFHDKDDLSVARAMLTGDNSNFDMELRRKYSGVGAMHILCVSGLHVGIIFLLLNSLFGFLNKTKISRWIKSFILLICIWIYALITGLSPSVLRASTMFTFIILGMVIQEKPNIYNSLFASAFLLLLIDPFILTSVGFQLSYLAVIAIVAIQPLLYNLFVSKYYLIDKAWAIITVSIAAQIGTAPLAIMYFHQFPNYFILTNLLVIPLSALILYAGFGYLVLSGWNILCYFPGKVLLYSIKLLNYSTGLVYSLPNPVSENLSLLPEQGILIYPAMISLLFFIYFKKKQHLFVLIIQIVFLMGLTTSRKWQALNRKEIIEYTIKGHTAVDFISGYDHVFIGDTALLKDDKKLDYHIKGNWVKLQLNEAQINSIQ